MPPALFERTRHGFQLARLSDSIVRTACLVVEIKRLRVFLFRLRVAFDGLLELLDVVGERDQVLVGRRLDFGELGLRPAPAADCPEAEECDDSGDEQPDHDTAASARLAATPITAAATTSLCGNTVDEIEQRRGHALAAMLGERLGRQAPCYPRGQNIAAGAKVVPDHRCVRALASERVMDRLKHAVGAAARLQLGGSGEDRDVHRPGAGQVDLPTQVRPGRPTAVRARPPDRRRRDPSSTRQPPGR